MRLAIASVAIWLGLLGTGLACSYAQPPSFESQAELVPGPKEPGR